MIRSWFTASADDAGELAEGLASGAEALVIDLSQSDSADVSQARQNAARFLGQARAVAVPALYVMVHDSQSALLQEDVVAIVPFAPAGVILPGAAEGADIQRLDVMISAQEARAGLPPENIRIVAMAGDTAAGVFSAGSYGAKSFRLQALAWSADRLAANLGLNSPKEIGGRPFVPFDTARSLFLLGAAAADVEAIDASSTATDGASFEAECRAAKACGFAAKFVLDARQAAIANSIFGR